MDNAILNLFYKYTYWHMSSDVKQCTHILDEVMESNLKGLKFMDQGIVLFMISEFTRHYEIDDYIKSVEVKTLIDILLNNWHKKKLKYLTTLGCVYGGLRSVNLFLKDDEVSKTIVSIKEFVYKNMIEKGKLCSDSRKKSTDGNMILACVPFGMFEPEDLVLVEAVKSIKQMWINDNLDDHKALLLAWYYVEQGTYSMTRDILKKVSKDYDLYKLVFAKLEAKGGVDEEVIIHRPGGNNNIYEPGNDERFPKLITEYDEVVIKAIAFPLSYENEVILECENVIYKGEIIDEAYWQYKIGPFIKAQVIKYNLYFKDKVKISTNNYEFEVLQQYEMHGILLYNKSDRQVQVRDEEIITRFIISKDDVLHISVASYEASNQVWHGMPSDENIVLEGKKSILEVDPINFSFTYSSGQKVLIKSRETNWLNIYKGINGIHQINCRFQTANEKFYGFGERYNELNQRGHTPDNFVYNQYKEQGLRTYIPMPFFVSNRGYGILANTSNYSKFDMEDSFNGQISIEVEDSVCELIIMPGTLNDVIKKNAEIVGHPLMLPKWAFGPWMSSNNWDSEQEVRKQVEMTNKLEIPSTALVIEAWSDEATFYIFNDATYKEKSGEAYFDYEDFTFPTWGRWPDPKGMVSYLHENHIKCILWQIPIIKQISSLHHLQKDKDEKTFIEKQYGVVNSDQTPYRLPEGWFKDSLLMDFSNKEGKSWWFNKRQYLIDDLKVDGFKTDGGEFIFGKDLVFSDGRTGMAMRNEYANDYIGAYYDFVKKNNGITFSRAGYKGANQYPAHWAGDEKSTFDAFKRSMLAGLSSGISGLPFWGWDLAGFSGDVPTVELFIRSTQMAAFCPIMQYHAESKGEFNQDRTPWNIRDRWGDDRAVSVYRYYANIRMNLLPYIYNEALKSSETGLPLMKALILDYEEDQNVHELWDQYMFGNDLMIAPVINEGATQRAIYFPTGHWINLFTNEIEVGPKDKVLTVPLEEMLVYVKNNCILPMNLNNNFEFGGKISNKLKAYSRLCFRVFGDDIKSYHFTDDLNNNVSIDVYMTHVLNIKIESTLKVVYVILDKESCDVKVNGKSYEVKNITMDKCELKVVEIMN